MTLEELFFNTSVFRVYVGPYSYGELNYCDRLHILITFIYIITPLLTSTHKPVLARAPSSYVNDYLELDLCNWFVDSIMRVQCLFGFIAMNCANYLFHSPHS